MTRSLLGLSLLPLLASAQAPTHLEGGAAVPENSIQRVAPTRYRLEGEVVDETGAPVSSARIELLDPVHPTVDDGCLPRMVFQTGADGRFDYSAQEHFDLARSGGGPLMVTVEAADMVAQEQPVTVQIRADQPVRVRLVLHRAVELQGMVVDEQGAPLRGATVMAMDVDRRLVHQTEQGWAEAGLGGIFRVGGLPPGRRHFRVEAEGYMSLEQEVSVPGGPVTFRMGQGAALSGQVLDPDTSRVHALRVLLESVQQPDLDLPSVQADAEGRFALKGLPDGEYWVMAERAWVNPGQSTPWAQQRVRLQGGKGQAVKLGLAQGLTISGRLLGPDGATLPKAQVLTSRPLSQGSKGPRHRPQHEAKTDADGRFEIMYLQPGRYSLSLGDYRFETRGGEAVPAGTHGLVLRVHPQKVR